jgi:hypothetical protein
MEEINYTPLAAFDIEPSLNDKFWLEQIKRSIQECNSVTDLKEMATLLAQIATQRQGVIKGLVKDMKLFNAVNINPNELTNPSVTTQ